MTVAVAPAWQPQLGPQSAAIRARVIADELFFGGARGPGKTQFILGDFLYDLHQGAAWQGVLFRRTYPELDEVIRSSMEIYPKTGGEYKVGSHTWKWANGAQLSLRHIDTPFDAAHYQGHSYSFIAWDELPNWPDLIAYKRLKATLRGNADNKRVRATGNPGGPGHHAVSDYFQIGENPEGSKLIVDAETGMTRMFIRGRVSDNKILLKNDPMYVQRLKGVGDPELVRAWLEGDWNAMVGGYFSTFRREKVIERPFDVPASWPLFAGFDYGEADPTAVILGAIDFDGVVHIIGEYYQPNLSASMHAEQVHEMLNTNQYVNGRWPSQILADPSVFNRRRGQERANVSPSDLFAQENVFLTPANNDRINGWRIITNALTYDRIKIFDGAAPNLVRTFPVVPRDLKKPEDIARSDDHILDALRYMMVHTYTPIERPKTPLTSAERLLEELGELGQGKTKYG